MLLRNAYRYRIRRLSSDQEALLERMFGCGRWVYNKALELQKQRLDEGLSVQSHSAMCAELERWKAAGEYGWLTEVNQQALQQRLRDLRRAFSDFFDPEQPTKDSPKFRKKFKDDTIRFLQGVKAKGRKVYLPSVGWVSLFLSRPVEGTIKNATIKREADGWYVSIQTEREVEEPDHPSCSIVGGDLGVNTFLALSNEESYPGARALRKYEKKLARLQRQLARKQRFSANWKKMKARIARLHQKIARVRHDAIDKLSTNLANNHAVIVLEDLRVVNMTASAKGTPEKPGKNVKQKASLNRAILDGGWSEFVRTLSYKLTRRGGRLLEVPAHYTSQRCAGCGHVEEANRKTVDLFVCQSCGHTKNAHTQAADNILARALEKYEQELREQYPKLDLWSSPPGDTSSETATADAVPVEACEGIGGSAPEGVMPERAVPREAGTGRNREVVASGV